MASAKAAIAVFAVLVLLLHASSCAAVAWRHQPLNGGGHQDGVFRGTPAVMTVTGFEQCQDGGGPAECDGQYHSDNENLVALSTGWYADGRRCNKKIAITSTQNGRVVVATVVDECDSGRGCEDNMVGTSKAVWDALGLDTNVGEVPILWSDVFEENI